MSATAELEKYIEQFKSGYKKYLPSEDSSSMASSIDTEELLSDMSSDVSSSDSYEFKPKKNSHVKSLSSLKKKKKKSVKVINKPSYLKPLHSTPLKIINEEEEDPENRRNAYNLSDFMPRQAPFDINKYIPQSENQRAAKIKQIIASIDTESETTSVCSSVDTEALLESSDEEQEAVKKHKRLSKTTSVQSHVKPYSSNLYTKPDISKSYFTPDLRQPLNGSKKQENMPIQVEPTIKAKNKTELHMQKANEFTIIPRRWEMTTSSLSVSSNSSQKINLKTEDPFKSFESSKKFSKTELRPSAFLNSITQNSQSLSVSQSMNKLTLCTCIIKGNLYSHSYDCRRVLINAVIPPDVLNTSRSVKKYGMVDSVVLIQRTIRNFLKKRKSRKNQHKPAYQFEKSVKVYRSNQGQAPPSELYKSAPQVSVPSLSSVSEIEKATQSLYQAIEQLKSIKQISSVGSSSLNTSLSLSEYNLARLPEFGGSKPSSDKRHTDSSQSNHENIIKDSSPSYSDFNTDRDLQNFDETSSVNTDDLLNSTFSSISSAI